MKNSAFLTLSAIFDLTSQFQSYICNRFGVLGTVTVEIPNDERNASVTLLTNYTFPTRNEWRPPILVWSEALPEQGDEDDDVVLHYSFELLGSPSGYTTSVYWDDENTRLIGASFETNLRFLEHVKYICDRLNARAEERLAARKNARKIYTAAKDVYGQLTAADVAYPTPEDVLGGPWGGHPSQLDFTTGRYTSDD